MPYIPGVCNITDKGRRKRLLIFLALASISIFSRITLHDEWRILAAPFIFISSVSLLEYAYSFCAYFGIRGMHEDEKGLHHTNKRYIKPDRRKSYKIISAAVIITILLL